MLNAMSRYLDVLCFPTLFPSSKFGEHHSSQKITKSRLMNKDRRFRKEDQYVFISCGKRRCIKLQPVCTTFSRVHISMHYLLENLWTEFQCLMMT